jgi:hypothetical protein
MIKIFDNFLDKETFTQIKNFIMGDDKYYGKKRYTNRI